MESWCSRPGLPPRRRIIPPWTLWEDAVTGVRRAASLAVTVVLALIGALGPVGVEAQALPAVRDTILENGLHVIVAPNHSVPLATVEVVIRAGAFTQVEPADEGVPHILEHMLFRSYRGGSGFRADANEAGAAYNGTTGAERVTYYVTLPSAEVENGIELMGRLVQDPDFSRDDLDQERFVVRGELERMASDPYEILGLASDMALWQDAYGRKNAIGNIQTIMAADVDLLRDHYERYYVPNNAALIVAGDVDPARVFDWAEDRFEGWDRESDPFADFSPPSVPTLEKDSAFVVPMPSTDVTFVVKWQGPRASEDPKATFAAQVFSQMFNQATSGAQRRLVDSGLFQTVSVGFQTLEHVGPIRLSARTTPDRLARGLAELGVELGLLDDPAYFDEDDLAAAKRALLVDRAMAREEVPSMAHGIADLWAVAGLDFYLTYEDGLEAVTLADVQTYMDRYLLDRPKVVAALATEELMQPLHNVLGRAVEGWSRFRGAGR